MKIRANGLGMLFSALTLIIAGTVSECAQAQQNFYIVSCTSAGGQSCDLNSEGKVLTLMINAMIMPAILEKVIIRDDYTGDARAWVIIGISSGGFADNLTPDSGVGGGGGGDGDEDEEYDEEEDQDTPILLDLDRNGFHLSGGPALFDIDADGQPETVTWVASGTRDAFLFLDRNGNGIVDSGSELFGTATMLFGGERAEHGYEALAEFDLSQNGGSGNGAIDSADSVFADLKVWIDEDANGVCEESETMSLVAANVLSLDLDYRESSRTDRFGNEFLYVSRGWMRVNGKRKKMRTADVIFQRLAQ